jgi:hypothetical protein
MTLAKLVEQIQNNPTGYEMKNGTARGVLKEIMNNNKAELKDLINELIDSTTPNDRKIELLSALDKIHACERVQLTTSEAQNKFLPLIDNYLRSQNGDTKVIKQLDGFRKTIAMDMTINRFYPKIRNFNEEGALANSISDGLEITAKNIENSLIENGLYPFR